MSRTTITLKFTMCLFSNEASYWAEKLLTGVNLTPPMPDQDNKFGGSLVWDFRKWWHHLTPKEDGALPIKASTGRRRPKEVPFSNFRYIKDRDFTSWGEWKGREICHLGITWTATEYLILVLWLTSLSVMLMFSISNIVYSIHSKGLERDAAFLSRYVKELLFFYKRSTKALPFMSKWYTKG